MSKKSKDIISNLLLHFLFIVICLIVLIPILYAVSVSFNKNSSLISSDFTFFPKEFTFSHYKALFTERPLLLWLGNTLILAVLTLLTTLLIAIPAAYAFSRRRFKGNRVLLNSLILLNAFPTILSMFALWKLMDNQVFPMVNTRFGLILIYTGTMTIFAIINLKGYFDTIPYAIEEAARIDGAKEYQIILRILLPLAKPAIIVTAMMILIFVWNEYIFSVTFLTGEDKYTLAAGLKTLQATESQGSWSVFAAASIIISLPILAIFMFVQKYMVSGLTVGGVKE